MTDHRIKPTISTKRKIRKLQPVRWLAGVGAIAYMVSPWFNALRLVRSDGDPVGYPGFTLLFFGWLGVIGGELDAVGWLANPCFLAGTLAVLFGFRRTAVGLLLVGTCIAPLSLIWLKEVPLDEAGNLGRVIGFDAGFWLWFGSIGFNLAIALLMLVLPSSRENRRADLNEGRATEIPPDSFV